MKNKRTMSKIEKKFLEFLEKHIYIIAFAAVTLIGFLIRFYVRGYESRDMTTFLLPWYEEIKSGGGLTALQSQVGNYNILYQFIIALFTYLPIPPIFSYKIVSCIFDIVCAMAGAAIVYEISRDKWKLFMGYSGIFLCPIVFMNSAIWGQCDSIFTSFLLLSLYFLLKEKYVGVFVAFGIAFSFKLQAVFLLPFYLFYYFYKRKFSIAYFLLIPVILFISSIPGIIAGRGWTEWFTIYFSQTQTYPFMFLQYPSFWALIDGSGTHYEVLSQVAILLAVSALALIMLVCLVKKVVLTKENSIYLAFLLTYTCIFFLPSMHERYGYAYEMLIIVLAVSNRKKIMTAAGLIGISLITYGRYLFETDCNIQVLAVFNTVLYLLCLKDFFMDKERFLVDRTVCEND